MTPLELYSRLYREKMAKKRRALPKSPSEMLVFARVETVCTVTVKLPMRLESEANRREHWRLKANRVRDQRRSVRMALAGHVPQGDRYLVRLTRFAPRKLDAFDNLPRSFKAVVDEVAAQIGIDDGDSRIEWKCEQTTSKAYGVEIRIEAFPAQEEREP